MLFNHYHIPHTRTCIYRDQNEITANIILVKKIIIIIIKSLAIGANFTFL